MKLIFFCSCLLLCLLASGQKKNTPDPADRYAQQIDRQKQEGKLVRKFLDRMSMPGGAVRGYYAGTKLVLIQTVYGAEYGHRSYTYYLRNDSLLLVQEVQEFWKLSDDNDYERFEAYRKKHTDKEGNADLRGWPLEIDDNNHYYFHDTVIVDFKIRSFKKAKAVTEDEIADKNKDLLRRLRIHCEELGYVRE